MEEETTGSPEDSRPRQGSSDQGSESDLGRSHAGSRDEGLNEAEAKPAAFDPLHVRLAVYDGPLELLLDLIKKNEMDIYDIQIAEITRQYLDYLTQMKQLDLEIAGEFLIMAATLLYIKSKMLLPQDDTVEEEDGEDPRNELVQKLLEYQAFKEAARELGLLEHERTKEFTRQITDYYLADLEADEVGIDSFSANLYDLLAAFQKVLSRGSREAMHEVYEEVISIEEKMDQLRTLLVRNKKVKFYDLFAEKWTRNELIATFLALLEIVRSKFAQVVQEKQYGDILIEKIETATPEEV